MCNVGYNPTFEGQDKRIEVHIFDFKKSIYDKKVSVEVKDFVRKTQHFSNVEEMVKQIKKDCDDAKKIALDYLSESKINEVDRKKMIAEIETKKDLVKLQIYIANALLKFEGLSLNDK